MGWRDDYQRFEGESATIRSPLDVSDEIGIIQLVVDRMRLGIGELAEVFPPEDGWATGEVVHYYQAVHTSWNYVSNRGISESRRYSNPYKTVGTLE